MFEEVFRTYITEVVLDLTLPVYRCEPKDFVRLQRLCAFKFTVLVETEFAPVECEFRQILQLVEVAHAKVLGTLELPELLDLRVRERRDFMDLDPLPFSGFLVHRMADILQQFVFLPFECIGQDIVSSLVFRAIFSDVAIV